MPEFTFVYQSHPIIMPTFSVVIPQHGSMVRDALARPLRDLRISVTDRCNFRCPYCMPREVFGEDYPYLAREDILSFEEIDHLVSSLVPLGIEKVRLTGGEPLLRRDFVKLVEKITAHDVEVAVTTNGVLLENQAKALADAGLDRVTVSLDALDNETFQKMTDSDVDVSVVLAGIAAASQSEHCSTTWGQRACNSRPSGIFSWHRGDNSLYRIHGCRFVKFLAY
jgi:cyclic pyranopterin phosphate synthase